VEGTYSLADTGLGICAYDKAGDAAMIAGYLGGSDEFDDAIGDYAVTYAD